MPAAAPEAAKNIPGLPLRHGFRRGPGWFTLTCA